MQKGMVMVMHLFWEMKMEAEKISLDLTRVKKEEKERWYDFQAWLAIDDTNWWILVKKGKE